MDQSGRCHSSDGLPLSSGIGGSELILGQSVWDLWSTEWFCERLSSNTCVSPCYYHSVQHLCFSLLLPICPALVFLPVITILSNTCVYPCYYHSVQHLCFSLLLPFCPALVFLPVITILSSTCVSPCYYHSTAAPFSSSIQYHRLCLLIYRPIYMYTYNLDSDSIAKYTRHAHTGTCTHPHTHTHTHTYTHTTRSRRTRWVCVYVSVWWRFN
jgi:hypothetical protein